MNRHGVCYGLTGPHALGTRTVCGAAPRQEPWRIGCAHVVLGDVVTEGARICREKHSCGACRSSVCWLSGGGVCSSIVPQRLRSLLLTPRVSTLCGRQQSLSLLHRVRCRKA